MKCPICDSPQTTWVKKIGSFDLRTCDQCHIRFSDPMQHPGQDWYEASDIYEEVRWNLPTISKLGARWEFAEALKNLDSKQGTLFDVGCGRGDFLKLAQLRSFDVRGVDLNQILVRVAQEAYGLKVVEHGTVEDFKNRHPDELFGSVTAFEVLEHVPDPHGFIRSLHSLLKPGGKLAISVPGYKRWPRWVNSEVDLPPHHLILWTKEALTYLFKNEGFDEIQTWRKPFLLNDLMYHVVRWFPWLQAPGKGRKILRGMLKVLFIPAWLMVNLHPSAGGFTLLIIGKKK